MPLTKPIPNAAMPVAEVLRRDVKRPAELPMVSPSKTLRWPTGNNLWSCCCPMGLHPQATTLNPTMYACLPVEGLKYGNIQAFGIWWDWQTDAAAAVEAVWPE